MEFETLRFELRDGVGRVTLNRPDAANSLNLRKKREDSSFLPNASNQNLSVDLAKNNDECPTTVRLFAADSSLRDCSERVFRGICGLPT